MKRKTFEMKDCNWEQFYIPAYCEYKPRFRNKKPAFETSPFPNTIQHFMFKCIPYCTCIKKNPCTDTSQTK